MARFVAKNNKAFFAIGSGLFFIATIITATFQSASDGYDIVGFPVVFYSRTAGKCLQCATYWSWVAFTIDAACCLIANWLLTKAVRLAFG